ncbi:MAG: hypothetical protein KDA60_09505 [Planctomycetales bacterium]|nr:hypothetical protein [Planctomycetales bacterium]
MATIATSPQPVVAGWTDLLQRGWTASQVVEKVNELRRATIEDLPPQGLVDPDCFPEILTTHPEMWRVIIDARDHVLGHWCYLSLSAVSYELASAGRLCARSIRPEMVRSVSELGWHDIYFLTACLAPELRLTTTSLLFGRSFFNSLHGLAEQGVYIRCLCANFATPEGIAMARGLGLEYRGEHSVRGGVYSGDFVQILQQKAIRDDNQGQLARSFLDHYPAVDAT